MVFGQIDLDTGGERATPMRKLIPQVAELANIILKRSEVK
jgi:hypothetical protein